MLTLVLSYALQYSIRDGCKVALAPLLTDPLIILAAVFLSFQIHDIQPALAGLSLIGALYLGYLGYETMQLTEQVLQNPDSSPKSLLKGMMTNVLNPHPYLFWFTVGVTMLSANCDNPFIGGGLFLLGFYVCLVGSKMGLAWIVGSSRFLFQGRLYTWTMRILGTVLLGFALSLAFQAVHLLNVW
jgi:threonine/homoserine/homoserine lactone efflux protein